MKSVIRPKFKIKENHEELLYTPKKFVDTYYQICQFKNNKNKYETRKIYFNEAFDIVNVVENEHDKNILDKFISNANQNKFKIYPTTNIKFIDYPPSTDFIYKTSLLTSKKKRKSDSPVAINLQIDNYDKIYDSRYVENVGYMDIPDQTKLNNISSNLYF